MTLRRRDVLKGGALGALATGLGGGLAQRALGGEGGARGLAPAGVGEAGLRGVRAAFTFDERHVPMNAANLCPAPLRVTQRQQALGAAIDADCSFQNRGPIEALREDARSAVATLLGAQADHLALVRNTSEANNIVNAGLDLGPGDEVVLWDQNHPTNLVAWKVRAARHGFALKIITFPANPGDEEELLAPLEAALSPRTRVVALSHVSNVSGLALPLPSIGARLAARGVPHFHVDGAQSFGALAVDLEASGAHSYSGSAHKWFMGPKEVGILWVREDRIQSLWPSVVAPGWGDDADPDPVGARKFESLGQRDDAALGAMVEAAALHRTLGPKAIEAQLKAHVRTLKDGLRDLGAPVLTPEADRFSAGVCIVSVPGPNRRALFQALYEKHGLIAAPTGGLRLSPHVYNTDDHIRRALEAVAEERALWA